MQRRLQQDLQDTMRWVPASLNYPYPVAATELEGMLGPLGDRTDVCLLYWILAGVSAPAFSIFGGFTPLRVEEMVAIRGERIESAGEDPTPRNVFLSQNFLPIMRRDAELVSVLLGHPPITAPSSVIYYQDEIWSRCTGVYRHLVTFLGAGAAINDWFDGVTDVKPSLDYLLFPAFRP